MKVTQEDGVLVIRIPIKPEPSSSGKTVLLASTHGNKRSDLVHDGQNVIISVNAYTYPARVHAARERSEF
jgi:hypothetical protein